MPGTLSVNIEPIPFDRSSCRTPIHADDPLYDSSANTYALFEPIQAHPVPLPVAPSIIPWPVGEPGYSTPPGHQQLDALSEARFALGLDAVQRMEPEVEPKVTKARTAKRATSRTTKGDKKSTTQSDVDAVILSVMALDGAANPDDLKKRQQAKRKSEIEKKSRQKRAMNMDTMKDQIAHLEQKLLDLVKNKETCSSGDLPTVAQLGEHPPHYRMARMRDLLASQSQVSMQLRNEQFYMYQRLQHLIDVKEAVYNVFSAHDFSDESVYDLLSWWTPPSDASCAQLAQETVEKVRTFSFSKHSVKNQHAGWNLKYDYAPGAGCKFHIARKVPNVNVASLAESIWQLRCDAKAVERFGGSLLTRADVTVVKQITKDMVIVNRTLTGESFCIRTLYLVFRTEVDGVVYIISRELGRTRNVTWDEKTRDFPETSGPMWMDVTVWSAFTKVEDEPDTHLIEYAGWWGSPPMATVGRWMLEMLFMVVRWEAMYIRPRALKF